MLIDAIRMENFQEIYNLLMRGENITNECIHAASENFHIVLMLLNIAIQRNQSKIAAEIFNTIHHSNLDIPAIIASINPQLLTEHFLIDLIKDSDIETLAEFFEEIDYKIINVNCLMHVIDSCDFGTAEIEIVSRLIKRTGPQIITEECLIKLIDCDLDNINTLLREVSLQVITVEVLMRAIELGNRNLVTEILECGDASIITRESLLYAIKNVEVDIVSDLWEKIGDDNYEIITPVLVKMLEDYKRNWKNYNSESVSDSSDDEYNDHRALMRNKARTICCNLLINTTCVEITEECIIKAIETNSIEIVSALFVDNSDRKEIAEKVTEGCLIKALDTYQSDIISVLLAHVQDVSRKITPACLHEAIKARSVGIMKYVMPPSITEKCLETAISWCFSTEEEKKIEDERKEERADASKQIALELLDKASTDVITIKHLKVALQVRNEAIINRLMSMPHLTTDRISAFNIANNLYNQGKAAFYANANRESTIGFFLQAKGYYKMVRNAGEVDNNIQIQVQKRLDSLKSPEGKFSTHKLKM